MKDVKKKILESIAYTREKLGFTLVSEDWGSASHKCACALGCVLLKDNPKDTVRIEDDKDRHIAITEILEVNDAWVDSFISGFDGNGISKDSPDSEAWELGFAIATETKPIAYHLWNGNPT
jgi:hypothetical protein